MGITAATLLSRRFPIPDDIVKIELNVLREQGYCGHISIRRREWQKNAQGYCEYKEKNPGLRGVERRERIYAESKSSRETVRAIMPKGIPNSSRPAMDRVPVWTPTINSECYPALRVDTSTLPSFVDARFACSRRINSA